MKRIIIAFLLLISLKSNAQNSLYSKSYSLNNINFGGNYGDNTEGEHTLTSDGGSVISGHKVISPNIEACITKVDHDGNVNWTTLIKGANASNYSHDYAVKTIEHCSGYYSLISSKTNSGIYVLNIVELDNAGQYIENSNISLPPFELRPSDMILLPNNQIVLTAAIFDASQIPIANRLLVMCFDPNTNTIVWQKIIQGVISDPFDGDMPTSIIMNQSGEIFVGGRTADFTPYNLPKVFLMKMTSGGSITDFRTFVPNQSGTASECRQLVLTDDNNIAMVVSRDEYYAGAIKVKSSNIGSVMFKKEYSANYNGNLVELMGKSIAKSGPNKLVIGGGALYNTAIRKIIFEIDNSGNASASCFKKMFGASSLDDIIASITNSGNGGLVVGGNTMSTNYALRKLDFGGTGACVHYNLSMSSTNNYTVSANLSSSLPMLNLTFTTTSYTNPIIASYITINTYDECPPILNPTSFGITSSFTNTPTGKYDKGNDVVTDRIGNTYVVGDYYIESSFGCITGTPVTFTDGKAKMTYVAKFDPNGNLVWLNHSKNNYTPAENSVYGRSIRVDNDGNVFIAGECTNSPGTMFTLDFLQTAKTCTNPNSSVFINSSQNITSTHAFVAKFDANGGFLYSYLSDATTNKRGAIAMDIRPFVNCPFSICNVLFVTGRTVAISNGSKAIFVERIIDNGNSLTSNWLQLSNFTTTTTPVYGTDIVFDGTNIEVVGLSYNGVTLGGTSLAHSGTDGFLFELDPSTGLAINGKIADATSEMYTMAIDYNSQKSTFSVGGSFKGTILNPFGNSGSIMGSNSVYSSFVMELVSGTYTDNWRKLISVDNSSVNFVGNAILTDVVTKDCQVYGYGSFSGAMNDGLELDHSVVIGNYNGTFISDEYRLFVANMDASNGNLDWGKVSNHSSISASKHYSSRVAINGPYLVYTGNYYGDIDDSPSSNPVLTGSNYNATTSRNTFLLRSLRDHNANGEYRNYEEVIEEPIIQDLNNYIAIFPNPTTDGIVKVKIEDPANVALIEVMDVFGRMLLQNRLSEEMAECNLDLSQFSSGMYLVNVKDSKGQSIVVTKLIKK